MDPVHVHGGSWYNLPKYARAYYWGDYGVLNKSFNVGLRCVRRLPHAMHGGSWASVPRFARASCRAYDSPALRGPNVGFHCVRKG